MNREAWSAWTDDECAQCRAGGRRAYNFRRRLMVHLRQMEAIRLMGQRGWLPFDRGVAPELARLLGVSRQTAWRDCRHLLRLWHT